MQFTERDRCMVLLGMALAQHEKKWVKELASVLPPNGDLSSRTLEAIVSQDDAEIRLALPALGINKSHNVRLGLLIRTVWDISKKQIATMFRRVQWAGTPEERLAASQNLKAYQERVDSLLGRWGGLKDDGNAHG